MTDDEDIDAASSPKDGLLRKLRGWYRKDRDAQRKWREEAAEDYDFVAGDQYSQDDKDHLKSQMRPIITFNRIDPLIRAVSGAEITARQEVQYIPREMGDAKANDVLTQSAQWFRDQSDAEDEESDAFLDVSICGMGWTETRLDYDDHEDGAPLIDRIDPLEMAWDHNSKKRNLSDARRVHRSRRMTLAEAKDLFPDADEDAFGSGWADDNAEEGHTEEPQNRYLNDDGFEVKGNEDLVTITETQWWERETRHVAADPMTGKKIYLTADEHTKLKGRLEMMGVPLVSRKIRKKVYKRAFYSDQMIDDGDAPCDNHFTFQAMTGFRDQNNNTYYGLVRAMKDPQRWANKWMSQLLHLLNSTAKGGVMVEDDAVEDHAEFEESWARTDAVTTVNAGALTAGKIKDKPQTQFPVGFFQMMEFAISSVRDVTGVNLELLGMREANQPASLEYQRRQASMTILATLFDALRRYRKNQGRVLLYYITTYLSDGRLVAIVGDEGRQYVPLVKQADAEYDVIVDEASSAPNQKEQVWQFIGPSFMSLPPQIQMVVIDYAPLPETAIAKFKAALKSMLENPRAQQMQQAQLQAQMAKIQADIDKIKSETVENVSNAQHNMAQADSLRQKANVEGRKQSLEELMAIAQATQQPLVSMVH